LSVAAVASAVFAMIEGPERGWDSRQVVVAFAVSGAAAVALVAWELRHPRPLIDPRLFRLPALSSGAVVITAESLAMFGFFLVGLQYLQIIKGYTPLIASLALLPLALGAMVFSPIVPRLASRLGYRPMVVSGMALIAAGLLLMSRLDAASSYIVIAVGTFLLGAGIAFAATPATEAIMAALPPTKQGVASALNDVTRELGGVLGIALLGTVFNATYRAQVADATATLPPATADEARDSVTAATSIASSPHAPPGLLADVVGSFESGMANATIAGAVVVVAGALVGLTLATAKQDED
jgi:predicted MFS family arabinose efflux permease